MKLNEIETRCNIDYQVNLYKFSNVMVEMHDSIHSKIHYYVLYDDYTSLIRIPDYIHILVNEINDRNGIK
jgi:hypothetical protein